MHNYAPENTQHTTDHRPNTSDTRQHTKENCIENEDV